MTQRSRESHRLSDPSTDLESAADALLEQVVTLGAARGLYSQRQLDRKIRHEDRRMLRLADADISHDLANLLLESRTAELIDAAGLTILQEIVYRLHVSGLSARRMASVMGIKRKTAERQLGTVKRKIRAAYREGRYAGWYEVYLSEVNRPAYRRRR